MDLNTLWFLLIAFLYIGFFILEGFDFGVGILLPFLGKNDTERRVALNTIGPHWDGNEVWLITAGGATMAAFPDWYATLFSGFYPAFFLLLLALILRGVAIEFRSKNAQPQWRSVWDWGIFSGSLVSALLLGVTFANLAKGLPVDQNMQYTGNLGTLLNPYALIGGLTTVAGFVFIGALFISLKTQAPLSARAITFARRLWWPTIILTCLLIAMSFPYTDMLQQAPVRAGVLAFLALLTLLLAGYMLMRQRVGWAFILSAGYIAMLLALYFGILFPRVIISNIDPSFSLTILTASSSPYTLKVMSIIALIFLPIVLLYQGWTYWIFRKRISASPKDLTY